MIKAFFISIILSASMVFATDRYVETTGTDAGSCLLGSPCLTLQYAINQSAATDTINVAAGTYPVAGLVTVNKTLKLLGAQNGVDARTRVGAESILSNTQGLYITASGVVVDGFTIQDSSVSAFTGYGIAIAPNMNGTQILNNIFRNNISGLGLANLGSTQCLVQHNLFEDNNLPGAADGTGIYTDEYVGQTTVNVLINENTFENNDVAAIGFSSGDSNFTSSNIAITNNTINNCGRGVYLFNTTNSVIEDNTFTNMTVTSNGSSAAITIFDGVSNVSITGNTLQTGPVYGIRIQNVIAGPAASNLNIHQNNITGFATAGMFVNDAPTSAADYATCNWWGSDTGPTTPLNPSGTGDIVTGTGLTAAEVFDPWLLGLAPDAPCGQASVHLEKSFHPSRIREGAESELTITLINDNNSAANLVAPLIDTLPTDIFISGASSTTCGGVLTAEIGSSMITLTGGSIPALGSCFIKVKVSGRRAGSYDNILPIGALSTDKGQNDASAQAALEILVQRQLGGGRSYCLIGPFCGSLWIEPPVLLPLAPEPLMTELLLPIAEVIEPVSIAPKTPEMDQKTSSGCNEVNPTDTAILLLFMLMLLVLARRVRS